MNALSELWTETGATPILVSVLLLLPIAYLVISHLSSRDEPPTVWYWIPWVGSALSLGKDPDAFFDWATYKYGPLFWVKTSGKDTLYATSPSLIGEIYRDQETYAFTSIRTAMSIAVFGTRKEIIEHPYAVDSYWPMHHRTLAPNAVPALMEQYTTHAFHALKAALLDVPQRTGRMRLRGLLLPPAYVSASHTLFGARYPALDTFGAYQEFDKAFPLLVAGAADFVLREPRRAWAQVTAGIEAHISKPENLEDASELVRSTVDGWRTAGIDDHDIAPILAADLWALNANAIWAVYWLIALHLQKRPERLAVLVAEIDVSRRAYFAAHPPSTPIAENPAALHAWLSHSVTSMPLLTSAIQETLRFTMNSGSLRKVMRDTVLGGYQLRAGARVVCYTRAVHLDEEVHECAGEYEPARYMNAGQVHIKDGRRVANHSMPFGGGVSMCEGRHFALAELRTFIALLLTLVDLRLDDKSQLKAEMDMQRIGLGIAHVKGDLDVFVTPRGL